MESRVLKIGEVAAKRQDPVVEWYLIKSGSVVRKFAITETVLGAGAIIGIMERGYFDCDYIAAEDTQLLILPCKNANDLTAILKANAGYRTAFLKTALEQRQQALSLYQEMLEKAEKLHVFSEEMYNDYQNICSEYELPQHTLVKMEHFSAIDIKHKAEQWEVDNSRAITGELLPDYIKFAVRDSAICTGVIMEASAQMHRVTLGISEIVSYLLANRDILYSDSGDDLYHVYYQVATALTEKKADPGPAQMKLLSVVSTMEALGLYDRFELKEAREGCEMQDQSPELTRILPQTDLANEDCVRVIMEYAGMDEEQISAMKLLLKKFERNPDRHGSDDAIRTLRKQISDGFYQIYYKAFLRSVKEQEKLSPILEMFFNFGFMDTSLLGEGQAETLYGMLRMLGQFQSGHIFTFYSWLLSIYNGEREPSKDDMGQDYAAYLAGLRKAGKINSDQEKVLLNNGAGKVDFELNHAFRTLQRVTYGRVTSFCPVMCADDIVGTFHSMAMTTERLQEAINKVRRVDYSIFYREFTFTDPDHGIRAERIRREVLPDIILLPNIGEHVFMWQETADKHRNTPARFMAPIFMIGDLDREILANMGRFRWEICRKEEGAYWNDVSSHSLTAEYNDYLQFYKKSGELSPVAKDKIKEELTRCRNNFREVFVADYQLWIRYESQGSLRLNRLTRELMAKHCPFNAETREKLSANPQFQALFAMVNADHEKQIKRLNALYNKYVQMGGNISQDLQENLQFYSM